MKINRQKSKIGGDTLVLSSLNVKKFNIIILWSSDSS